MKAIRKWLIYLAVAMLFIILFQIIGLLHRTSTLVFEQTQNEHARKYIYAMQVEKMEGERK